MVGTDLLEFVATPEINSRVTNVGHRYSLWLTVGGEEKILPAHNERVAEAQRRLKAEADEELARMIALKAVNPSVRDSEIDALRKQREDGLAMLDKAALRLEAIRVLVAG